MDVQIFPLENSSDKQFCDDWVCLRSVIRDCVAVFRCRSLIWWTQRSVWWRPCSSERSTSLCRCRPSVRPRHDPCRSSTRDRWTSASTRTFAGVPSTQVWDAHTHTRMHTTQPSADVCPCVSQTCVSTCRCQKRTRTTCSTWRTCRPTPDTAAPWWTESFTSTPHKTPWTSEFQGHTDWMS